MKPKNGIITLTQTALLTAIIVVLALTPLGYLPVGPIRATTIHIPVIIGAILLGPKRGALLGGVFGLTSFLMNTLSPAPASFVFSPLAPGPEGVTGNPLSLVITFVPRVLIGVVAGCAFGFLLKRGAPKLLGCAAAGFLGSITNTLLVLGGIYAFFGRSYAAVKDIPYESFLAFIAGMIGVNGVVEAVVAAVITAAVAPPLMAMLRRLAVT